MIRHLLVEATQLEADRARRPPNDGRSPACSGRPGRLRASHGLPVGDGGIRLSGAADGRNGARGHPPGQSSRDLGDVSTLAGHHPVGHPVEEHPIMAHDDHRAGPVLQEVFQGTQGVEIQVVRGLVEEQHVRTFSQNHQQLETPALATRESPDGRPRQLTGEPEAPISRMFIGSPGFLVGPATRSWTRADGSSSVSAGRSNRSDGRTPLDLSRAGDGLPGQDRQQGRLLTRWLLVPTRGAPGGRD